MTDKGLVQFEAQPDPFLQGRSKKSSAWAFDTRSIGSKPDALVSKGLARDKHHMIRRIM